MGTVLFTPYTHFSFNAEVEHGDASDFNGRTKRDLCIGLM